MKSTTTAKMNKRQMAHMHALRQADEAGCPPADGKVLAYMAENVEWQGRTNLPAQHIRIAQTRLAENLGMHPKTVHKSIKSLVEAGLVEDTEHGIRNRKHLYKVTIDWSFSYRLMQFFGVDDDPQAEVPRDLPKGLIDVSAPRKPRTRSYPRGTAIVNRKPNHFCTIESCAKQLSRGDGWAIMFDQWTTFCDGHKRAGIERAERGFAGDSSQTTGRIEHFDPGAVANELQAIQDRWARDGMPRRSAR